MVNPECDGSDIKQSADAQECRAPSFDPVTPCGVWRKLLPDESEKALWSEDEAAAAGTESLGKDGGERRVGVVGVATVVLVSRRSS